jgi:hypothetical protein
VNKTDPVSAFMERTAWRGRQIIKEATVAGVSLGHPSLGYISSNGNCIDVMGDFRCVVFLSYVPCC